MLAITTSLDYTFKKVFTGRLSAKRGNFEELYLFEEAGDGEGDGAERV